MPKKRDWILIASLLLISILLCIFLPYMRADGEYVVVRVNGTEVARYPLHRDGVYPLNQGSNLLCIENGQARITEANCPDGLCIRQGKIDAAGETLTCLPNRLTVTVYGKDASVDLIG